MRHNNTVRKMSAAFFPTYITHTTFSNRKTSNGYANSSLLYATRSIWKRASSLPLCARTATLVEKNLGHLADICRLATRRHCSHQLRGDRRALPKRDHNNSAHYDLGDDFHDDDHHTGVRYLLQELRTSPSSREGPALSRRPRLPSWS